MWSISSITGLVIMVFLSLTDIRSHRVPVKALVMSAAAVAVYHLAERGTDLWLLAGGAGVGAVFLIISRVTGEGLGYGDSWGILILGCYLGLWGILAVLSAAFLVLGVFSIAALSAGRMSRRYTLPFFPFLTLGYVWAIYAGGLAA